MLNEQTVERFHLVNLYLSEDLLYVMVNRGLHDLNVRKSLEQLKPVRERVDVVESDVDIFIKSREDEIEYLSVAAVGKRSAIGVLISEVQPIRGDLGK